MHAVWKYEVSQTVRFSLDLPRGAIVLVVQNQHEMPYIWVLVDPDETLEERRFFHIGTGDRFDYDPHQIKYVGTYQRYEGEYVFHLFEVVGQ